MTETADVRELARSLYLKHRAAVELIYRNRPDYVSEAKEIFRSAIVRQPNWALDGEEPQIIFFRSVEWDCFEVFKTGTGWRSGSLVTLGFDFRTGHPNLICTLGPGTDEAVRRRIHAGISQHPKLFSQAGSGLETSYTRLAPTQRIRRGCSGRPCRRPASSGPGARSRGWARRSGPCDGPCPPARCGR